MSEFSWINWIPVVSTTISAIGLLLVLVQLRRGTVQREAQCQVQIYDINRQLLTLGFSCPELFEILDGVDGSDAMLERRYLQLWLNQLAVIHTYIRQSAFNRELEESLLRDLGELVTHANVRRHWRRYGSVYPASFQKLINGLIKKNEPPTPAAHEEGTETV